ncbi:MAG: iron hydrogenase small subunit [Treponema sp.]|uniref:NADH-dependent [FeFe] hydrogenase, group A6 n=1 Tax=Treponema sp. TaxID=166 RepID=UPI00298DF504|nr:NADH-dependent [FeFe] hydrogenase, group A6 [Treponema sp.]MBR0155158.1 iron hydrogenase small subunit [Treponema sp.]
MVTLTINGKEVSVKEGTTILAAAKSMGMKIPTLCHSPDLKPWASCGLCVIKNVDPRTGRARMARACCTTVTPGMNIVTDDAELRKARRTVLELILSNHPQDCLKCSRNQNCELQKLACEFGLREIRFKEILKNQKTDDSYAEIVLDRNKCINCGRCVEVCQNVQNVHALEYNGRGDKTMIGPVAGVDMAHSPCIHCGQCAVHCPVGAITFNNPINDVFTKLADPSLTSVVSIAPAVRAAIGEEFGFAPGTLTTGKIYAALRALGFKYVFDTNFAADLTIMEEGNELIERIKKGGKLPMFTSCCPGWVDYCEKNYQDMLPHLSTAKSPQQMEGAMTKTYFADSIKVKPKNIFNVSVMPCTAKLFESTRDKNMKSSGVQDYDMVLTTRELAKLIREAGIDFANLPEEKADSIMGAYTGAGTIFGATGGVMEAALRTAYFVLTGKEMKPVDYKPARGLKDVKTAEVKINKDLKVRIAIVHQMGNVDAVVQQVRQELKEGKEPSWHFIEVMACRGGCVAGGGQPYGATDDIRKKRANALYKDDGKCKLRQSHKNPEIAKIYKDFLGKPLGEKSHHLLHTTYTKRDLYRD